MRIGINPLVFSMWGGFCLQRWGRAHPWFFINLFPSDENHFTCVCFFLFTCRTYDSPFHMGCSCLD